MATINAGRFSFYSPNGANSAPPGYQGSELQGWMKELEQSAYYGNWLGKQDMLGVNNQSDLARSLENRFQQGYQAQLIDNPDFKWADYLDAQQPNMSKIIAGIDPGSRGYQPGLYTGQGNTRWLPRSR